MASKISNIFSKILLGMLLVLMIAGVAVWGVNDILTGNRNKTIAKVGNAQISEYELETAAQDTKMRLMQSGMNLNEEFKTVIRNNALMNLIADRLLQNEFRNLSIEVDGKDVLKSDYLDQLSQDKESLQAAIRSQGGEEAFLKRITKEKKIDFLQGALTAIIPTTDSISQNIYSYENQSKDVDYIELSVDVVKTSTEPTDADLEAFYEENKDKFLTPEYRSVSYVVINKNILKDQSEDTDIETQLHEISGEILDRIAGGETLEEISKEYDLAIEKIDAIDAEGLSKDGAEILNLPKVEDFLAAVFGSEEGEISDILESGDAKSYAFLRVDSITEKNFKPFDEVKNLVIAGYQAKKQAEQLVEVSKQLKKDLDAGTTTLADFAAKNGLTVQQKTGINYQSKVFSQELVKEISDLRKGDYSGINKTGDGKLVIAQVTNVSEAKPAEALALFQYKAKIQEDVTQEIMAQYLDYLKEKYNVSVYTK